MRKVMLHTFLFLPFLTFAQSGDFLNKKVTLQLSNITLEKALSLLEISYDVEFSYSDDIVPVQTLITLNIENENLTSALGNILTPYKIEYKISGRRIILRKSRLLLTQTIRGLVIDQVTNVPIPGATILVGGTSPLLGSTTSENGEFKISQVDVGRVTIVVKSVGYNSRIIDNVMLGTGKELVMEVKLAESVIPMREIVVLGSRGEGIPGSGMAVTSGHSFTVEDTKRYAGSFGDPARMATAFAGITGASDESNALIVRGNSPRGVLWRIEGIEVPNPNHFTSEGSSSGVVSILSPNMIDNSDFLTGAFPASYGNSLSAVFDINLREGNNERQEHTIQAGLLGTEVSTEGPFSKDHPSSYLVNYRYSTLSILDKLGFELNEAGQYKNYQDVAFKIHYPTRKAGTFSLFGLGGMSVANKADTTLLDNNSSDVGTIGLTYKNILNESTLVQGALSFSGTRISRYNEIVEFDTGAIRVAEDYAKSFTRASLSLRRKINAKYFLEGGIIYSLLHYNFFLRDINPGSVYKEIFNFREQGHTSITQGFLYAQQYLSPSFFGFYGVHAMHFKLSNDLSIEPRAGIRWQIRPTKSLSLGVGKHSRVENLQYYLARDHQPGGDEVQINKNLGFTRADHYVLGYEQKLFSNHNLKIETYYQKIYNAPVQLDPSSLYASINEDSGFITDTLVNGGKGKNYGVELTFGRPFLKSFYYLINGSLFESSFKINEQERSTAYNGNYSFHLLAGKEFEFKSRKNRLGINIKMTMAGGRPYVPISQEKSNEEGRQMYDWENAYTVRLPDYFRSDLQIVYRTNRPRYAVEWRLDIQNFTHHRNSAFYYYDTQSETIKLKKQVGLIPLLTFKMEF